MTQQLRRLHILLVDNDPHARDKVQQALGNEAFLRWAHSLDEALDSLEASLPDVLLCEIDLPGASGLELCQRIRSTASWRHLPIMLLTTLSTLQDKVAGFEAGADDYLVKPFDGRHLVVRIRLLSRIKRLESDKS